MNLDVQVRKQTENRHSDVCPEMDGPRRKRKKINPLAKLKDVNWNPYDETLKANRVDGRHSPFKGDYKLDYSPDEEDE